MFKMRFSAVIAVLCLVCFTAYCNADCVIGGVTYPVGSLTPDPCNRCSCAGTIEICNRMGCPPADCVIDGVTYPVGSLTPDPCNRCSCAGTIEICNAMGCPPELAEYFREKNNNL